KSLCFSFKFYQSCTGQLITEAVSILRSHDPFVRSVALHLFHPFPGIDQSLYPRRDFLVFPACYIIRPVPGSQGSLDMRHNCQMPSIIRCNACYRMGRTVGVAGIGLIAIGHAYVVVLLCFWEVELALTMCHPYA